MTIDRVMLHPQTHPDEAGAAEWSDLRRFAENGDHEAFSRIVHRYVHIVYTFCVRQLGDRHLAEDVTQAVFILLARKASSLREGVVLCGWLFDAARYCCQNARRTAGRRARREAEAAQARRECSPMTDETLEQQELHASLHTAIAQLTARARNVLLLRYFEQRSFPEIASLLNISEDAAKHRVGRAVENLRRILRADIALSAAVGGHLPEWMELHALLKASSALEQAVAAAAGGSAGSAPATIAAAAAAQMSWAKLQLLAVMAGVMLLALGGAFLLAPGTQPAPAPTAATVEAPQLPPPVLEVQVDQTSPLAVLRSLGLGFKLMDEQVIEQCLTHPGDDQERMLAAGIRMNFAQGRLDRAFQARFDGQSPTITDLTVARFMNEGIEALNESDVKINGDRASIGIRITPAMLQQVPQLAVVQGMPLQCVRDADGNWRIDAAGSLACLIIDQSGVPHRGSAQLAAQLWNSDADAIEQTIADIEQGRLTDPRQAQRVLVEYMNQRQRAAATQPNAVEVSANMKISTVAPKALVDLLPR
jgi:RNA polymerase sigma factor (sigma-70 family)